MKRFSLSILILLGLITFAQAQVGQTYWPPLTPSPTTTFDPVNLSSAILSLSSGNLAVSTGAGGSIWGTARSITSHSTGKYYVEFTMIFVFLNNGVFSCGVTTSAASLSDGVALGHDANLSVGTFGNDTNVYINSISVGTISSYIQPNIVSMALDAGNKLIWFRVNGGEWNASGTANPATGVGGISIASVAGPYFAAVSEIAIGDDPQITGNFGGSVYSYTPPSGFGNW